MLNLVSLYFNFNRSLKCCIFQCLITMIKVPTTWQRNMRDFQCKSCCRRGGGREREREMVRIFLDVDVPWCKFLIVFFVDAYPCILRVSLSFTVFFWLQKRNYNLRFFQVTPLTGMLHVLSSGCLWEVMIKLEPLVAMIGDKVNLILSIFCHLRYQLVSLTEVSRPWFQAVNRTKHDTGLPAVVIGVWAPWKLGFCFCFCFVCFPGFTLYSC